MATDSITSWQIVGEKVEAVTSFIFLCSQITVDSDYSHEIKRCLLLGRKIMTNLDNLLKSRDIILLTKVCLVKAMIFPVVMFGCESWIIKKTEHQRTDAFKLWFQTVVLEKMLESPLGSKERRSNQSILKEISPEYSLEGLMLKLKLQYFSHLMWRMDSLEKTMMLGKIEGRRGSGWQRMRWLGSFTDSMNMNLSELQETLKDRQAWCAVVHGVTKSQTWLSDWATATCPISNFNNFLLKKNAHCLKMNFISQHCSLLSLLCS